MNQLMYKEIDKSNMLDILLNFHHQLEEAQQIGESINLDDMHTSFDNIVYCGMGGSAICGDFLKNFLIDKLAIPMEVVRNYTLPNYVSEKTLLIVSSYSGNTEETLSCLNQGIEKKAYLLGISSNGEVEKIFNGMSVNDGKLIKIPSGYPPRTAFGYVLLPLLYSLCKLRLVEDDFSNDITETIKYIEEKAKAYNVENIPNRAYELSKSLNGTIPVIYGTAGSTSMIARRWTTQFSENAKIVAYYNEIPEMNHNEIVGWENLPELLDGFTVIFLKDTEDLERIVTRQRVIKDLLLNNGDVIPKQILEVESEGNSRMTRWMSLIYLGDFISWYSAIGYGTDPTPVKKIDILKKTLAKANNT